MIQGGVFRNDVLGQKVLHETVSHLLTASSIRPRQVLSQVYSWRSVSTSSTAACTIKSKCVYLGSAGRRGREVTVYTGSAPTQTGVSITSNIPPLADGVSLSHSSATPLSNPTLNPSISPGEERLKAGDGGCVVVSSLPTVLSS